MKKLVSAATSLVMAATMVGAVAPVVAGAADAKKGLTLKAYKEATLSEGVTDNGSVIEVSADAVKAGDVKVPVGLYLTEETADLLTIGCGITVNSDNADAKNIKFSTIYEPGATTYFDAAKSFTGADGTEFTTNTVVAFAGSYNKRLGYSAHGSFNLASSASEPEYGVENAYIGVGWNNAGSKYEWFGAKSDDYPVFVFDVTIPKGTAEGNYDVSFVNTKSVYGNPLCILESSTKYDAQDRNNLDLTNLTIKVGDAGNSNQTTTSSSQTTATTVTTATTGSSSSSSSKTDIDVSDADIVLDFINPDSEDGYWHAEPGEKELFVDMHITGKDATVKPTGFALEFTLEGGITAEFENKSPALGMASMSVSGPDLAIGCGCPQQDGHGTVIDTSNNVMVMMTLSVPDDIADGLYEINLKRVQIDKDTNGVAGRYNVAVKPGYVKIGDSVEPPKTTATTASSATTATTATTASTGSSGSTNSSATTGSSTTGSVTPGTPLYGDTNCDNVVRINDVVLLNKYLNDNKSYAITSQGKLNADCYNPKNGEELTAEDSDAIIKSIVHLVELPVKQ